jgi:tripartite-type tricarboxylate transporter receptor subunit TctC
MRHPVRRLVFALCVVGLFGDAGLAAAQTYPTKPVKVVVGYTPGGFTDSMARIVSQPLSKALGQPVVIENKPGANSIIGSDVLAKSPADGYTIGMVIAAHAANASLYPKLPFDTLKDFAYVSLVGVTPLILVANNNFPASSVAELIAYAKANPGKVNFGSSGIGAAAHLTMEYFMSATGTKMVHVPYKGTAPALTDLIGGQIGVMFDGPSNTMPHVKAGKIKALAIANDQRLAVLPEVPTVIEGGVPGFVSGSWAMMLAPAATPRPIVARLSTEVAKIVRSPEMRERFASMAVVPGGNTPEEATEFVKAEIAKWGKIVREANVKVEN